jgi:tripartite-type tricarboxylate transporter receptor subunit TctC
MTKRLSLQYLLATTLAPFTVALASLLPAHTLAAEAYPNHQVNVVVPFPPGGNTDYVARILTQGLSNKLGQTFVVDNKAGAGGNIGTDSVVRAKPDGYTLLASTLSTYALNAGLYSSLPFDPVKDLTPVGMSVLVPLVMVVPASLPVNNLQELIQLLKDNPGKYNYGSAGNGTSSHIALYLFGKMTGTNAEHIPYRGTGPLITDALAGRLTFMVDAPSVLAPHIASGALRPLAVALPERLKSLPNVPTMEEAGLPGYEAYSWNALWAPKGTPAPVLDTLHTALMEVIADPKVALKLEEAGVPPFKVMSRAEADTYMKEQFDKWVPLVKDSGAKVE